jgi:hypothetical protein
MDNDEALQVETCVLFRAWNDQIRDIERATPTEHDFVCECSDESCTRVMPMDDSAYGALRVSALTFAVVPGHEEGSEVLICAERYVVVRKNGASSRWMSAYVAPTESAPTVRNPAVGGRPARRARVLLTRVGTRFANLKASARRRRAEAGSP